MPTYSSAIADNIPEPQRPQTPPPATRKRSKEFWEVEPGDPEANSWKDNPEDPKGPQIGNPSIASVLQQETKKAAESNGVVITDQSSPKNVYFDNYVNFVNEVTSNPSKNGSAFISRIAELQSQGCEIQRLLTAAVGINAEGGEFMEIVKKMAFQGKPWNDDNIHHLKIELGDILWYVAQACISLDISLDELLRMNVEKLSKRYPQGTFDSYFSENRKEGDI
jgi:NTP pyrophosphatase (non-canonical NTP hydrolase)